MPSLPLVITYSSGAGAHAVPRKFDEPARVNTSPVGLVVVTGLVVGAAVVGAAVVGAAVVGAAVVGASVGSSLSFAVTVNFAPVFLSASQFVRSSLRVRSKVDFDDL